MANSYEETAAWLRSATVGFDYVFSNDIAKARTVLAQEETPFHLMGLGVCAFLEAALGMETGLLAEAARCLSLAEAGAKKQKTKAGKQTGRFAPGLEWEVLSADTIILNGMTSALGETYMGYMQCIYALNSAHSKFSKLYKTVFPKGLDDISTPAHSRPTSRRSSPTRKGSQLTVNIVDHVPSSIPTTPTASGASTPKSAGFFSRLSSGLLTPGGHHAPAVVPTGPDGPVEDLIVSGVAFGYGLFNLIFSLLPAKIRGVVGFFGFQHDRKVALKALAVSADKNDVHSVFAGLALMTYHGVVLLLSGYQADEAHIIGQYQVIVDKLEARYPTGSLWILNRAKILRMSGDADNAIKVLQDGLKSDRTVLFQQADALLVFELAWTLLGQRRFQEAADMFIHMTEINSWSQGTYYFIAAGCHITLGNYEKAKELFAAVPDLIEKRKISGKDLPTEVFIKKRIAFYQAKQARLGGPAEEWVKSIKISPAEELAIFWNNHARVPPSIAEEHIRTWMALTPQTNIASPVVPEPSPASTVTTPDLDTPDELALRSLLLGITHRTAGHYVASRAFLEDAVARHPQVEVSTWIGGVAYFEQGVLDLREYERSGSTNAAGWANAIRMANDKLDKALGLAGNNVDLSSRLDTRISMLRDEMALKKEILGIV